MDKIESASHFIRLSLASLKEVNQDLYASKQIKDFCTDIVFSEAYNISYRKYIIKSIIEEMEHFYKSILYDTDAFTYLEQAKEELKKSA